MCCHPSTSPLNWKQDRKHSACEKRIQELKRSFIAVSFPHGYLRMHRLSWATVALECLNNLLHLLLAAYSTPLAICAGEGCGASPRRPCCPSASRRRACCTLSLFRQSDDNSPLLASWPKASIKSGRVWKIVGYYLPAFMTLK